MSKESSADTKERSPEKLSRIARNLNALGALAIGGVALAVPGPNAVLAAWAGINAAQAGGFEWLRRRAKKSRTNKFKKSL